MARTTFEVSKSEEPTPVFLTSVQVADMLKVTPRTMENMRLENRGPRYIRLGREGVAKVVYDLRDVEAWLNKFVSK